MTVEHTSLPRDRELSRRVVYLGEGTWFQMDVSFVLFFCLQKIEEEG